MLNKEKYAKEIAEIACNGKDIAIVAGKPMLCCEASCDTCDIEHDCTRGLKEWANSEYVEPPVDWSKIPIDTPILVRDYEKKRGKEDICKIRERNSVRMGMRSNILERIQ